MSTAWCTGGVALVQLLRENFDPDQVIVRSPHHVQVKQQTKLHDVWIDSYNLVKYRLSGQSGRAVMARSAQALLGAIRGYDHNSSDLVNMRKALELSELIESAKAALPLSGLPAAIFVDAGFKDGKAQIGVVEVLIDRDGEHVKAESHPCAAASNDEAERAAIDFALAWSAPQLIIFSDSQGAVARANKTHAGRVRWLPREQNKIADRLANMRKRKNKRRRRKDKSPDRSKTG